MSTIKANTIQPNSGSEVTLDGDLTGTGTTQFPPDAFQNLKPYTAGGTADAQTITLSPTPSTWTGVFFLMKAVGTNTGAMTITDANLGVLNVKVLGSSDPGAGSVVQDNIYAFAYNGTDLILLNPTVTDVSTGSFTLTTVGAYSTAEFSGTANYRIIGSIVFIELPYITGTSNSTDFVLGGFPSAIQPTTADAVSNNIQTVDNNVGNVGRIIVHTDGTANVHFSTLDSDTSWTASGNKRLRQQLIMYELN